MATSTRSIRRGQGFTLIEMVMVIVVLGVISGMVAVFMKGPIDAYFASARRAAVTDVADLTVRRVARDLRGALPNSIGPSPSNSLCVEFIPTKTGGRYLADDSTNALKFNTPVTAFQMLGPNSVGGGVPASQVISANDYVVVYNLGITGSDAYNQDNVAKVTGAPVNPGTPPAATIQITSKSFPLASASKRFHVVPAAEQSVAYVCDPSSGHNTLVRRSAQSFTHLCSSSAGATDTLLASNVTACSFQYSGSDLQRNGLISIALQITQGGETVSLQQEIHVNNTP